MDTIATILRKSSPYLAGDFLVVVEDHEYKDVSMLFRAYECVCLDADGTPNYERFGAEQSMDLVTDFREAQPFMSGYLKWDGCCNIKFDGQEDCDLHFCGIDDTRKIGKLFEQLYFIAPTCVAKWDSELAK